MWKRSAFLVVALLLLSPTAFVWAAPKNLVNTESPVSARCVSADGLTYESCRGNTDDDGNVLVDMPLRAGEDDVNNLVMSSGGKVRGSVGNVASGLLVGADCTSHCTPATYVALPKGSKTFTGTVVSSTSGGTTVAQVQKIYGADFNTFTSDDAELLCTITFTSATQYLLKAFQQSCAPITSDFLFYGVIASGTTGSATITGAVTAKY